MAPEPLHLVNITKTCPRCNSTDVKFVYFNNYLLTQPRYKCKGCRGHFTYGGTIRPPRVARPPRTSTTSTPVVAADRRTGPARRGRPRHSQPVTPNSGAREIQETPSTRARTEARTVTTRARARIMTEARTVAARTMGRPSTGALTLRRIPISEQPESPVQSPVVSPVVNSVVNSVESPAVRGPVPSARNAGLVLGGIVDVDQRPASRTAPTMVAQGGDVMVNWTKAVLGVPPYDLRECV